MFLVAVIVVVCGAAEGTVDRVPTTGSDAEPAHVECWSLFSFSGCVLLLEWGFEALQ